MDSDKVRYFFPKVLNRIAVESNRLWKFCDVNRVSMCGYKPFNDSVALKKKLRQMLGSYSPDILVGVSENERNEILTSAGQTLDHVFNYLGSGPVNMDIIDWHSDFKCGAKWEKIFYREIGYIKGADIKIPWELSRCQHLLWLGEAYLLTEQDKYAQEIIDEINWWIDDNPLMYSVNWTCAMDVAFRAVNWLFALNLIAEYSGFDDAFSAKISRSLWQHGFFIRHNLEKQIPCSNNHYASDIVGLLYLGALFNKTSKGGRWLRFALKEYEREVAIQVLDSGVHYERSVSYHRLMTELFSYPIYMLSRIGAPIKPKVIYRIRKMYDYIACYSKPNGYAPLVADNDDGRFVPFLRRDFRSHDYLNNALSIENRFVALGSLPIFYSKEYKSKVFKDAGVAIIKHGENYLFINNGGFSKHPKLTDIRIGTHTHNDLLSFELALNGKDIIVDPGTYLYSSSVEERNAFRSTSKHNTVVVDGEEQNGLLGLFVLKRNVQIDELCSQSDDTVEGEYATLDGKLQHVRGFTLKGNNCIITDTLSKNGNNHIAFFYYHFADGLLVKVEEDSIHVNNSVTFSFSEKPESIELLNDTISPSFGVLKHSQTAVIKYSFNNNIRISTKISIING